MTSIKGCNSVANLQKIMHCNPNVDLVNVNVYTKFGRMQQSICIHGPLGAGDIGDMAGLKCRNLTSDVSHQCHGCAGVLISR